MDLSINVLVVDDMGSMRRLIKNNLTNYGFSNIIEAENGKVALEMLNSNDINLIVSDWNMPEMTGIELLREVRKMEKYANTPFVMVTAEGQKQNVIDAVQAGVTQYVVKPFTPDQIKQKLDSIFIT